MDLLPLVHEMYPASLSTHYTGRTDIVMEAGLPSAVWALVLIAAGSVLRARVLYMRIGYRNCKDAQRARVLLPAAALLQKQKLLGQKQLRQRLQGRRASIVAPARIREKQSAASRTTASSRPAKQSWRHASGSWTRLKAKLGPTKSRGTRPSSRRWPTSCSGARRPKCLEAMETRIKGLLDCKLLWVLLSSQTVDS